MDTTNYSGPSWDNSSEYKNFSDPSLEQDLNSAKEKLKEIDKNLEHAFMDIDTANNGGSYIPSAEHISLFQQVSQGFRKIQILSSNLSTFAHCSLSVDGQHQDAKELLGRVQQFSAQVGASFGRYHHWLTLISDQAVMDFLSHPEAQAEAFVVKRLRLLKNTLLSVEEETLIKALEVNSPTAFGNLYTNLSSEIQCAIGGKKLGLAEATALLEDQSSQTRASAYQAINEAWSLHATPCTTGINALAGWRLSLCDRRGTDFLDSPLYQNCLDGKTLDAMMSVIAKFRQQAQSAIKAQAKILGQPSLGPWDLLAPFPVEDSTAVKYTFSDGIQLISNAVTDIAPEMAEFVNHMVTQGWIEGSVGPSKRPGAYCTGFLKSRTPRVYMTYAGGIKDLVTLAHELGHAYHSWVMRDQPIAETGYPMTLAETASILTQTVVNNKLLEMCTTETEKLKMLWNEMQDAVTFLLNIPTRFYFEKSFYEQRKKGPVSEKNLCLLMEDSWKNWYGDSLSEGNPWFWASKLHFHISGLSFYNYPYSFGYLFALGVLGQRTKLGPKFFDTYKELLKDTGKMTAEDVAKKHLGADLHDESFWENSLEGIGEKIELFSQLADKVKS